MVATIARSVGTWGPAGDVSSCHPTAYRVGKTFARSAGVVGQSLALALSDAGAAPVGVLPGHGGAGGVGGVGALLRGVSHAGALDRDGVRIYSTVLFGLLVHGRPQMAWGGAFARAGA